MTVYQVRCDDCSYVGFDWTTEWLADLDAETHVAKWGHRVRVVELDREGPNVPD